MGGESQIIPQVFDIFDTGPQFVNLVAFFTTWTLTICLVVALIPNMVQYVDIVFLATLVLVISTFIVHVWPRRIKFITRDGPVTISGPTLVVSHIILHVLPMLIVILAYRKSNIPSTATAVAVVILLVYVAMVNPHVVYDVSQDLIALLVVVSVCTYILIRI